MRVPGFILLLLVALMGVGIGGVGGVERGPEVRPAATARRIGVLTFNIRYANPADGANAWHKRRDWVAAIIADERLDVIGVQEALKAQLDDLRMACPKLGAIGAGRDDGKEKGESAPILYRTDKWTVERSGTFWLSEQPEEPGSKSWGAACTRICTWARLRPAGQEKGGVGLWIFNTHLDHQSAEARVNGARLIAGRIADLRGNDAAPVIVTGDFNAGEGGAATRVFTGANDPATRLADTYRAVHPDEKNAGTFNGFDANKTGGDKIDYVLASPDLKTVDAWIDRRARDGRAPSDHWPVGAVVEQAAPER